MLSVIVTDVLTTLAEFIIEVKREFLLVSSRRQIRIHKLVSFAGMLLAVRLSTVS